MAGVCLIALAACASPAQTAPAPSAAHPSSTHPPAVKRTVVPVGAAPAGLVYAAGSLRRADRGLVRRRLRLGEQHGRGDGDAL
jgi:hypothetical protein